MITIKSIRARQILDSRATPTVEVQLKLSNDNIVTASAPSGASVSKHEAYELRDNYKSNYLGKSVTKAVSNVNTIIERALNGKNPLNQEEIDNLLINLDSTKNKSNLGANAILPVSICIAKAGAKIKDIEVFKYLRSLTGNKSNEYVTPKLAFNILNGGLHAGENIDFQEFLVIPKVEDITKSIQYATTIYQNLKKILQKANKSTLLGDEGGFAPVLKSNEEALSLIIESISKTGLSYPFEVELGIDVAASSFYKNNKYSLKEISKDLDSSELLEYYVKLNKKYPLLYLEDPFYEEDFESFARLKSKLSTNCIICGDDLISTNPQLLKKAINENSLNCIIIKLNQIGTVSETLSVIKLAQKNNIKINVSHRSGETNDDFIADLAIAVSAQFTKFGAPARGERVAKYNRLLKIAEDFQNY